MPERPRFNPHDRKYQSYDDLPPEAKKYFARSGDGFVLMKAHSNDLEAKERAWQADPDKTAVLDVM